MRRLLVAGVLLAVTAAASAAVRVGLPEAVQVASGDVQVPAGELALGTVALPRRVMADGKPLAAGSYEVRLTAESAKPDAPGQLPALERWVEFRQNNQVRAREVVTIVPQSEIKDVAKTPPPGRGASRVELLKGDDYLRVWINRDGTHFLIHLPVG